MYPLHARWLVFRFQAPTMRWVVLALFTLVVLGEIRCGQIDWVKQYGDTVAEVPTASAAYRCCAPAW